MLFRSSADPDRLELAIPSNFREWVIIDEIQKIPELLNTVHRLIESRGIKFILTGSSARSLRKKGTNLLGGRAAPFYMHPLVAQELGNDFDIHKALRYGLLPSVTTYQDPEQYLKGYVQTYVQEEVLQDGLTRNIGAFNRFLEAASFSQGSVVNASEIARELSLSRYVVTEYFNILEDLLLATRLSAFTARAKRKVIAHQKFYFFDAGVFNHVRPRNYIDSREEIEGATLETLFLQSLRAINDYNGLGYTIYFWQTTTEIGRAHV